MTAFQSLQPIEDRLIRHFFNESNGCNETVWTPVVDVYESPDAYRIEVELPGINKADIEVHYEDDILSVKAKRNQSELSEGVKEWKRERKTGTFYRSFRLVKDIKPDTITAQFADGVLTLSLAKVEKIQGKRIEIQIPA